MHTVQTTGRPAFSFAERQYRNERRGNLSEGIFEYLLVVQPGGQAHDRVMQEKQEFARRYPDELAPAANPQIKVAGFWARDTMEETIIRWGQRICSAQRSFKVSLNNFSGFPPHTIYLRVQDPAPFQQLARGLQVIDDYVKSCQLPAAQLATHPHLSLAHCLPEEVYTRAMFEYARKDFHSDFMVEELVLLKRQGDQCTRLTVFGLQPSSPSVLIN